MKITRRQFSAGTAALPLFAVTSRRAEAATFHFKCATNLPITHPLNVRISHAIEQIKAQSNGQVQIMLFPNSVLGGDTDMLTQVRSGAIQFFTLSGLILSTLVPIAALSGVGFAFKNYNEVWAAMDGAVGGMIRDGISKSGLMATKNIFDNGFRQITTSTHPINTPADLHELKIRVPPAALWTSMFTDFGSTPTTINFNEVYSALQTHVVSAEENPLAVIDTAKLYEVQKYCSITNHMWDGYWFLMNPKAFSALPAKLQALVEKEINAAALAQRQDVLGLNNSLQGKLTKNGLRFNNTDALQFRDVLRHAGFYTEWRRRLGSQGWDALEKVTGKLA
jgi:tripartite ATP-independent transporter DctP family solute receptor